MKIELIKKLCSMSEKKLYSTILKYLKSKGYTNIRATNMYIIAEGDLPICLLAHMDTVFSYPPQSFYYDQEQSVLWSKEGLGADDRAGIYIILSLIERGYKPSIIFTSLEERGGIGADTLIRKYPKCPLRECKALIQLDRQGSVDAVYYDCDNKDFENLITSYGFITDLGTFTDISIIAPSWGIAAVNLSVGYTDEHTKQETLNLLDCESTLLKVQRMLGDCKHWPKYDYIPFVDDKPGFGVWWSANKCQFCGRSLRTDQGRVVGDPGGKPEDLVLLCDDCYNYLNGKISN